MLQGMSGRQEPREIRDALSSDFREAIFNLPRIALTWRRYPFDAPENYEARAHRVYMGWEVARIPSRLPLLGLSSSRSMAYTVDNGEMPELHLTWPEDDRIPTNNDFLMIQNMFYDHAEVARRERECDEDRLKVHDERLQQAHMQRLQERRARQHPLGSLC